MAKKNIHPHYHTLHILIGDERFETKSTYSKKEFRVEKDFRNHPAWTGKHNSSAQLSNKNVEKFNKNFGIDFGSLSK